MNQQPYPPPPAPYAPAPAQMTKSDEDQLDLLGILFYVYACIVAVAALFCIGFAVLGIALVPLAASHGARHEPEPWMFGTIFLFVFGLVALLLGGKCTVLVLAGRACRGRSGYVMPMVGAIVSIINMPLGTALGVYALITITKPAVKARLSGG